MKEIIAKFSAGCVAGVAVLGAELELFFGKTFLDAFRTSFSSVPGSEAAQSFLNAGSLSFLLIALGGLIICFLIGFQAPPEFTVGYLVGLILIMTLTAPVLMSSAVSSVVGSMVLSLLAVIVGLIVRAQS
ncbi:hypothetical protein [Methanoculleus taiwanensis]|uniref:hypothetical protein n=1 Tax=Methanoculleus taiwanensis TaxID=1550565 RepID=UPI000FFE3688|nr:hypothetical protein [Methanoculleus taiwanensis]